MWLVIVGLLEASLQECYPLVYIYSSLCVFHENCWHTGLVGKTKRSGLASVCRQPFPSLNCSARNVFLKTFFESDIIEKLLLFIQYKVYCSWRHSAKVNIGIKLL